MALDFVGGTEKWCCSFSCSYWSSFGVIIFSNNSFQTDYLRITYLFNADASDNIFFLLRIQNLNLLKPSKKRIMIQELHSCILLGKSCWALAAKSKLTGENRGLAGFPGHPILKTANPEQNYFTNSIWWGRHGRAGKDVWLLDCQTELCLRRLQRTSGLFH